MEIGAAFPSAEQFASLDAAALAAVLAQVDRVRRQAEVLLAEGVALAEQRSDHRRDGHRSVHAWGRAEFHWSTVEAVRIARNGRVLADMPLLRDRCRRGDVGVAQLSELGRVHANPRCADQLAESDALLTDIAARHWFGDFKIAVDRWESLADADGALREHHDAHAQRTAGIGIVGKQVIVRAQGGTADGDELREIFAHFCDAEFLADWDEGRARLGDDVSVAALQRTDGQRRFDALMAIFATAGSAAGLLNSDVDPLVNVVVDERTAEDLLMRAAGVDVPVPSPTEFTTRRCETSDGVPLDPESVLSAMLVGRLRRVVVDSAGVVIDLGRKSRLFTGGAKDAVILGDRQCMWPGCEVRTGRCQTDHSIEWATGDGTTSPGNGGRACGHHNRHKSRGYRVYRDEFGVWHHFRPDGSEIGNHSRPSAA
jgi:hypothetical protein